MHKLHFRYRLFLNHTMMAILFFASSLISAQGTGSIVGSVTDKANGEPMIGANLIINGTSLGAASDFDGKYKITNVSEGVHEMIVSYLGYQAQTLSVNVTANRSVEIDVEMVAEIIEGSVVVVDGQAKSQLAAINEQLSSNKIVNVVSAEKMQELPDANIAESIGRLPGISLQRSGGEAYAVVVRGLSPKYNKVTIEGVSMSSTNSGDRSIDLSLLSNDLVRGVEVSKTLMPNMDANALGGTVNLTLKSAPVGFKYNVQGNGGYTNIRDSYNNYKFSGSVSDRFLDNHIGILAQGSIELKQLPSDRFNASYGTPVFDSNADEFRISTSSAQLEDVSTERNRYGLSLMLDYQSDFVDVKFLNIYDQKVDSTVTRSKTSNFSSNAFTDYLSVNHTKTEQQTHSLQALFKFWETELPISLSYTKGRRERPNALGFEFNQTGLPTIPTNDKIYAHPADLIDTMGVIDPYNSNTVLRNITINSSSLTDESYDAKLDWKIPFKINDDISGIISAGAKFNHVKRSSSASQQFLMILYGAGAGNRKDLIATYPFLEGLNSNLQQGLPAYPFVDPDYNRTQILGYPIGPDWNANRLVYMQNDYMANNPDKYWSNGVANYNQTYIDEENAYAGYIMGEFNIGSFLTVVPGVRFQEQKTEISAYHVFVNTSNQDGLDGRRPVLVTSKRNDPGWYPSINIKYKPTEIIQIMGAVYRSASLPNYNQINPYVQYQDGGFFSANPNLRTSRAWNADLGASVFNNEIGLVTVNLFYKQIDDLIFYLPNYYPYTTLPTKGVPEEVINNLPGTNYYDSTWANSRSRLLTSGSIPINSADPTFLRGIELSWQTNLYYLPGLLSGLVLDLNVSFMSSSQQFPYFVLQDKKSFRDPDTLVYGTTEAALQDQPEAIYNAIIGWDYKDFSSRVSFRYQQKTLTSVDTRYNLRNSYYDNVLLIDVSVKQEIMPNLDVFLNATNIGNHVDKYYYSHPEYISSSQTYQAGDLPTSGQTYGWALQMGISYKY